jgi:hypothetical protein
MWPKYISRRIPATPTPDSSGSYRKKANKLPLQIRPFDRVNGQFLDCTITLLVHPIALARAFYEAIPTLGGKEGCGDWRNSSGYLREEALNTALKRCSTQDQRSSAAARFSRVRTPAPHCGVPHKRDGAGRATWFPSTRSSRSFRLRGGKAHSRAG